MASVVSPGRVYNMTILTPLIEPFFTTCCVPCTPAIHLISPSLDSWQRESALLDINIDYTLRLVKTIGTSLSLLCLFTLVIIRVWITRSVVFVGRNILWLKVNDLVTITRLGRRLRRYFGVDELVHRSGCVVGGCRRPRLSVCIIGRDVDAVMPNAAAPVAHNHVAIGEAVDPVRTARK
ncbi:hypothetical protein C8F01DRAFT_1122030 [Mycena amicta]|nr:hypothetical protein C8F01DRAFT_1122030 [Mycena amicta]